MGSRDGADEPQLRTVEAASANSVAKEDTNKLAEEHQQFQTHPTTSDVGALKRKAQFMEAANTRTTATAAKNEGDMPPPAPQTRPLSVVDAKRARRVASPSEARVPTPTDTLSVLLHFA